MDNNTHPDPDPHLILDPVVGSVAAYTDHVDDYEQFNADKVPTQALLFLSDLPAKARILDAGCGPGRDMARFVEAGHTVLGVDLNEAFVAKALRHGPALLGDLRDLPAADASFDAVWACASLVHLPPGETDIVLAEVARVARAGAKIYVSVKHAGQSGWADTPHGRRFFHIWDVEEFVYRVQAAGLVVDRVDVNDVFVDVWAHA